MGYIQLKTDIPGPNSQALLQQRAEAVTSAFYQSVPIFVKQACGSLVEDVDGNVLIDLAGGIGALGVGHTPEPVVEAINTAS